MILKMPHLPTLNFCKDGEFSYRRMHAGIEGDHALVLAAAGEKLESYVLPLDCLERAIAKIESTARHEYEGKPAKHIGQRNLEVMRVYSGINKNLATTLSIEVGYRNLGAGYHCVPLKDRLRGEGKARPTALEQQQANTDVLEQFYAGKRGAIEDLDRSLLQEDGDAKP